MMEEEVCGCREAACIVDLVRLSGTRQLQHLVVSVVGSGGGGGGGGGGGRGEGERGEEGEGGGGGGGG